MIMARTGRQLAISTYPVAKRLQAFRPPTWDIHTGCPRSEVCHPKSVIRNLTSKVRSPKSKVLSPISEVLNPKLEVRSPKSDVLFLPLSFSLRKESNQPLRSLPIQTFSIRPRNSAFPKLSPKCQTSISKQTPLQNHPAHASSHASSSDLPTIPFAEPK